MQIIIGLIIIAGIIYFFVRKWQRISPTSQQEIKKSEEDLFSIGRENNGNNSIQITIDLNEHEFIQRAKEGNFDIEKRSDENTIEDVTGFYGSDEYSYNKVFCVSYCDGYYENNKRKLGEIALVKDKTLLFKKKIPRPNDCKVSNEGIVICCDWNSYDGLDGRFLIFDTTGKQLFSKKTNANLGTCAISDDSKIAIFETHNAQNNDGNKVFIVDVELKKLIQTFERICVIDTTIIDTANKIIKFIDNRGFVFETDFEGKQTNVSEYENQVMTMGSVSDRLWLLENNPDEIKFKNDSYLELLNKALLDKEASYSFGQDKIYRKIGEFYESTGNTIKTIENWDKAIQINPKIGIKRKLDILKRKL
jgi:hypothetical protein